MAQVSVSVDLPNAGQPYIVVPCTFANGKEGPFLLEVTCETTFQLDKLRKPEPTEQQQDGRRDSMASADGP